MAVSHVETSEKKNIFPVSPQDTPSVVAEIKAHCRTQRVPRLAASGSQMRFVWNENASPLSQQQLARANVTHSHLAGTIAGDLTY